MHIKYSYKCNTVDFCLWLNTHIYILWIFILFMQNMHIISYKYSSWELYSILCLVKIYTYVCIYICLQSINIDYRKYL